MEDTLRETVVNNGSREYSSVLILVLMEDTLRGDIESGVLEYGSCLNPCFNGRYS